MSSLGWTFGHHTCIEIFDRKRAHEASVQGRLFRTRLECETFFEYMWRAPRNNGSHRHRSPRRSRM